MGTRQHRFRCEDCLDRFKEEGEVDGFELYEKASFWVDMEYMNRNELLQHIGEIECPDCESKNWIMTDGSQVV